LAIAVVTLVAIATITCLYGMLGPDSHGSGGMLGPANPNATGPGGDPIYPAAGPNGPAGPAGSQAGQPGQPVQSGQAGQPGQPGPTGGGPGPTGVQTTTNAPVAHLSVGYIGTGLSVLAFQVTVTVTNTGGASGQWSAVGVTLTGSGLTLSGISSTVTHLLRGSTHCFTPSPAIATVAPGGSVSFSFTVVANLAALLGNVGGVTLNSAPCV
jgi:hypothetical protein